MRRFVAQDRPVVLNDVSLSTLLDVLGTDELGWRAAAHGAVDVLASAIEAALAGEFRPLDLDRAIRTVRAVRMVGAALALRLLVVGMEVFAIRMVARTGERGSCRCASEEK
jgi:hypothetical protein